MTSRFVAEVRRKSEYALEAETARKWAGRACACYRIGQAARGDDYAHEALEHGALVGDYGKTVGRLQRVMDEARLKYVGETTKQARRAR